MTAVAPTPALASSRSGRRAASGATMLAAGEPVAWLMAAGLGLALVMISGLLALVLWNGGTTFWPGPIVELRTLDGATLLGEEFRRERYRPDETLLADQSAAVRTAAAQALSGDGWTSRSLLRTANFDVTGTHFTWISDYEIVPDSVGRPEWAIGIERLEFGRFFGFPLRGEEDRRVVAEGEAATWAWFEAHHREVRRLWEERRDLETHEVGGVNRALESERLRLRGIELREGIPAEWVVAWSDLLRTRRGGSAEEIESARTRLAEIEAAGFVPTDRFRAAAAEFEAEEATLNDRFVELTGEIARLDAAMDRFVMVLRTVDGVEKSIPLAEIVRAIPQNQLGVGGRLLVFLDRWREFLLDGPREANSEGGVFPAIFGTVAMTLIMTLAVVPFGVLAALYLREYAKGGAVISAVRIAVNNLAGVPSIVFGVFGLGFFCYVVGASIDQLLFEAKLPNPTFGKGGLLWSSLTLALLTLPVVIVATEEALAAVPRSMREGSYACGASKWQTIRRIVLPRALPGIMTGAILAMARGAGEVAPLMLVGAVKLAPELPIDGVAPFVHPERSFMHLGFHIYDLGFQSQNSEAAKPMVFTTTLLLIVLIALLNLIAIWLRSRLRRRFAGSQF